MGCEVRARDYQECLQVMQGFKSIKAAHRFVFVYAAVLREIGFAYLQLVRQNLRENPLGKLDANVLINLRHTTVG
jgi:hypothetical protein